MSGSAAAPIAFDNSYARLPERFFARLAPSVAPLPRLVRLNRDLAALLRIDPEWLASPEGIAVLAGSRVPPGADSLAMAYAGHQFGNWVPRLGDGRALLLGEVIGTDGVRRDIQLKGSGRTPFSRSGDGRAAIGPALREYIVSEAMAALGIPTTRSLAVVLTGDQILREGPQPGAVLTRVAQSHVRVGTFQYLAGQGDTEGLRLLADYVISRHYPEAAAGERPYRALLEAVIGRTASLVARWQLVGFIHGVMNTDNMQVAGETIDYGPCAFMDHFHPDTVYSSIDVNGRYAYANQPYIAHWNMVRLAEALLPLLDSDREQAVAAANEALETFPSLFEAAYLAGFRQKLGLGHAEASDLDLAQDLLARMASNRADFTLTFRRLSDAAQGGPERDEPVRGLFADPAAFDAWARNWRERLAREGGPSEARAAAMRRVNPAYIPRNHRVQAALAAAQDEQDFAPLDALVAVLGRPYEDQPDNVHYQDPPRPQEVVRATFCGT